MVEGGPNEYEEKKFAHCTKAMLCLNAVGGEAIPDINVRADTLANMCVGRENLEEVFRNGNLEVLWKIAPSNLTLPLLNCLVLIYASSRDSSRVNLAKKLLQILLEDSDFKDCTDVPYPDVRTCKAVLAGLVGINDRRIRWTRVSSPSDEQAKGPKHLEDSSPSCLEYGVQLLDHMFARSQCWPDQSYFHSLLRLLLMARPQCAGETADMLLSKMYIRECFGKLSGNRTIVTRKTYHYVLRAWLASAEAGDPQAARRALELVELMEAQSLPLLSPADSGNSDGPTVYRASTAPDRSTYQLLLKTCGSIKVESEKEDALDIALFVDKKMKKRGITPTSDTYSLLFACCANLLPENSKRRQNVTRQLLEDARQQGNVNEVVLKKAKNGESVGSGAKGRASSGGGLLSDLV
jgi:Pentatricopeptide repeat domain